VTLQNVIAVSFKARLGIASLNRSAQGPENQPPQACDYDRGEAKPRKGGKPEQREALRREIGRRFRAG
jgi:hypothetical protein